MFVATLSTGKLVVEGKDVPHFDACPDGITSMQLMMPYIVTRPVGDGHILKRNAVISIGRYDKYYCAKQAIANIMSVQVNIGQMTQGGQGIVTHEILAGIDESKNEVVYLTLNVKTGDVTVDKFDYDKWLTEKNINPSVLKNGAPKK